MTRAFGLRFSVGAIVTLALLILSSRMLYGVAALLAGDIPRWLGLAR